MVMNAFDRQARDLVERSRPIGPADRILDLGDGGAAVARVLRERLGAAARIAGADWSRTGAAGLPFPDGAFELVLCQELLQILSDRAALLAQVRRVLAPRGRFLASTGMDADTLRAELAVTGFIDIRIEPAGPTLGQVVRARRE